jgi:hypothetical protein
MLFKRKRCFSCEKIEKTAKFECLKKIGSFTSTALKTDFTHEKGIKSFSKRDRAFIALALDSPHRSLTRFLFCDMTFTFMITPIGQLICEFKQKFNSILIFLPFYRLKTVRNSTMKILRSPGTVLSSETMVRTNIALPFS